MTTIHNVLLDKYLLGIPLNLSTLLDTSPGTVTSIIKVVADAIPLAFLRTTGADGPSSFNTISWHCLIMQLFFNQLLLHYGLSDCSWIFYVQCTEAVHPDGLSAFVTCHFIPHGKQPGVCPIDISVVP